MTTPFTRQPNSRTYGRGARPIDPDSDIYRKTVRTFTRDAVTDAECEYARLQGWSGGEDLAAALNTGLTFADIAEILGDYTPKPLPPREGRPDLHGLARLAGGLTHLGGPIAESVRAVLNAVPAGYVYRGWCNEWVTRATNIGDVVAIVAAIRTSRQRDAIGDAITVGDWPMSVTKCANLLRNNNWSPIYAYSRKISGEMLGH